MVAGCREQVAAAELEGADYDVRMTAELAHFILTEGGDFAPTEVAQSHWARTISAGRPSSVWPLGHSNSLVVRPISCRRG